jgi:hypothetical protein
MGRSLKLGQRHVTHVESAPPQTLLVPLALLRRQPECANDHAVSSALPVLDCVQWEEEEASRAPT